MEWGGAIPTLVATESEELTSYLCHQWRNFSKLV